MLKTDGKPFPTEQQTNQAIKNRRLTNHQAVQVAGGYSIVEQQKPSATLTNVNNSKTEPLHSSAYDASIAFSIPASKTTRPHSNNSLTRALPAALDKVFGNGWFNRLLATGKFKIIDRAQAQALGAKPNAQAFFNPKDDSSYFVADNIDQGTNLVKLMLHEIGVHALSLGKDSAEFAAILQQIAWLMSWHTPSQAIQDAIKAAKAAHTPAHLMLEEILGYLVENHPNLSLSQKFLAWFKAQIRAIAKALPNLEQARWNRWANTLHEADIVHMATNALRV